MPAAPFPALDLPTIHRALAGDGRALARVYVSHRPLVLRAARRVLACLRLPEPAAELAAEVWLRLLDRGCRPLRGFDPTRGSFRRYLELVAWQQALVIARRWARRSQHEEPFLAIEGFSAPAPCAAMVVHHRRILEHVLETVPRLDALDLTLFEESLLGRTPVHELASRLGRRTAALHARSHRLRTRLRRAARALEAEPTRAAA